MSRLNKLEAVLMSVWMLVLLLGKKILAAVLYPVVYLMYDDSYKTSVPPKGLKWVAWLFYDYEQDPWGPKWYWNGYCGVEDINKASKWTKFYCAYRWSASRNSMYNVNYRYMSNYSKIVWHEVAYDSANTEHWYTKLRHRTSDRGTKLVWYKTDKGQNRYLLSVAKDKWNFYIGWNCSTAGRFTMANKVGEA